MAGEGYISKGGWQEGGFLRLRCPALNPMGGYWHYRVAGYCAADLHSGRLVIPSVEEYETLCTTDRFCTCRRFVDLEGRSQPGTPPKDWGPTLQAIERSLEPTNHGVR